MAESDLTPVRPTGQRPGTRSTDRAAAKPPATKQRRGPAPVSRDRQLGRFEGMRAVIRALLTMDAEKDYVHQFLAPREHQRALAERLGVPMYFVGLLDGERMCSEERCVGQEDIDEWEAWRRAYPEVA